MPKVIDSLTGVEFETYQDYLNHVSPVTGFRPTDPEHHGKRGLLVAKKALGRTGSLSPATENAIDAQLNSAGIAQVQTKLNDNKAKLDQEVLDNREAAREANKAARAAQ